MNNHQAEELRIKHEQLLKYHDSLCKTHQRVELAAAKSFCAYRRAVRVGRKIIERSRRNKAEATRIFRQMMAMNASCNGPQRE